MLISQTQNESENEWKGNENESNKKLIINCGVVLQIELDYNSNFNIFQITIN